MLTRVTGVLVEDDRLLLVEQEGGGARRWHLPGGKVEEGESLADSMTREMREETGLRVEVVRLLYLCDHLVPAEGLHVLHITFEVRRLGGRLGDIAPGADFRPILGVEFVPFHELGERGFGERFVELVAEGFPGAGRYAGPKSALGL
ncbi:NUDIX domain-containing protein [Marinactinospora thermotolerans]|uniref:ADP-ribose pyrophosphatase YjhB, NUDIX family n=1 Tax=Marinactinospora thermotolerans DSM 45154 TaxID=1122192 RepID=A0A1T4PRE9_9ACTN|nr:NUDIX hydrolase [Marinactinospora thermotolerans]SJZ94172.1 ADP-ribose pyrophosphatase YjhB, NUDIX family [Marinactinospora thermotolerans DSM 45154]